MSDINKLDISKAGIIITITNNYEKVYKRYRA